MGDPPGIQAHAVPQLHCQKIVVFSEGEIPHREGVPGLPWDFLQAAVDLQFHRKANSSRLSSGSITFARNLNSLWILSPTASWAAASPRPCFVKKRPPPPPSPG